jgi:hypothetical protein
MIVLLVQIFKYTILVGHATTYMTYYIKCRENYIIFPHSMIHEMGWMSIKNVIQPNTMRIEKSKLSTHAKQLHN